MKLALFPQKFIAAMIAVCPLPGSPLYKGNDSFIMEQALEDLDIYESQGVDAVILENGHDIPFIKPPLSPDAVLLMSNIAKQIRKKFSKPIGIEMLEAANETALAIAIDAHLDFIRVETYVYADIGPAGLIEGCAGKLLRLRRELKGESVQVFVDVKKKHAAHAITGDLDITDEVKQAELFCADGIIITSNFTGIQPKISDLVKVKKSTTLPVIVGSGMTSENIHEYFPLADGFIVGSTFRKNGQYLETLNPLRLQQFMETVTSLKAKQ